MTYLRTTTLLILLVLTLSAPASPPFYIGLGSGFGSTTWQGITIAPRNRNAALESSLPIGAKEGGHTWEAFAGMQLAKFVYMELQYRQYPIAKIEFTPDSIFALENNGRTTFKSKADELSILTKLMVQVPNTNYKVFSGIGFSRVHRQDLLYTNARFTPTFNFGTLYPLNDKMSISLSGSYTIGYGESILNPAKAYVPFLYTLLAKIAYRIA